MNFKAALCLQLLVLSYITALTNGQSEGSIRLITSANRLEGRIEVFTRSQWGTVCDDEFGVEEARVACSQLGLSGGVALFTTQVTDGTGLIAMDNLRCVGNETSLFQCYYITNHNCAHSEDVGVRCNDTTGTTVLPPTSTTTAIPSTNIAFSVAITSPQNITDNIVYFDRILLNDGGHFDASHSVFVIPNKGLYWLSWSVGVDANNQADAYMTGSDRVASLVRGLGAAGYDTISRDEIFDLNEACGLVRVLSNYRVYSDSLLQTSLTAFTLDTVLDSNYIAFSFVLSQSFSCALATRIPFDIISMDEGSGWSATDRAYYVPRAGTYVMRLSVGAESAKQAAVGVFNYGSLITGIQTGSTNHGFESLSKTFVSGLNAGDQIFAGCVLYNPSEIYSEVRAQTKLSGFLYNPQSFSPIAWSVANNQAFLGPIDNVTFPIIFSNVGGGWQNQTTFVVPDDGVYFITMSTAVNTGYMTRMDLLVNGVPLANVFRSSTDHNGIRFRSRSLLYKLAAGDQLRIRVPSGYQLYSSDNRLTTFSGFRIYYSAVPNDCQSSPCLNGGTCNRVSDITGEYKCTCPATSLIYGTNCQIVSNTTWFGGKVTSALVAANTPAINYTFTSGVSVTSLQVSATSLYWHHLAVGVPRGSTTLYQLNGLNNYTAIDSSMTLLPDDMITSDTLQWMPVNTALSVSNQQPVYSNIYGDTAWLGFQLDNRLSPLRAFHVANINSVMSVATNGIVPFSTVLVNEGGNWNAATHTFTASVAGIYFFAYTTQSLQAQNGLSLYTSGASQHRVLVNTVLTGKTTLRGSIMQSLAVNSQVNFISEYSFSASAYTNYAQGFLYAPVAGPTVAWSVANMAGYAYGPIATFTFPTIEVNVGGAWNTSANTATIPAGAAGTYVLDLTTWFCTGSYCSNSGNNTMDVLLNGVTTLTSLHLTPMTSNYCITRSRLIIVPLNVNDQVKVTVPTNACLWSGNGEPSISFTGFLLY